MAKRDLNHCAFIGNLGRDPEIKYLPSGSAVANFSIACNYSWKDKETGEEEEQTEWVRLVAFGKVAEVIAEYAKKGQQIYVSGAMRTRKYTDKENIERYTTEIVVETFQFLGGKRDGSGREEPRATAYMNMAGKSAGQKAPGKAIDYELNEDVPF